jgi:L-2-hydroxyglutarate oxidase LhgO
MSEHVDSVVIGAGVIGLAVARALAQAGREVIVLESADAIGTGTSSRNSEVIHAGIYYPTDSLKAALCVEGKRRLYAYCDSHRIAHRRCGKLLVATDESQIARLDALAAQAEANGVDDLRRLDGAQARATEPALNAVAAVFSPSSGIVDSHGLMLSLQGDAEAAGAMIAFLSPLEGGTVTGHGFRLEVGGVEPMTLDCRHLVNCAGLHAQKVAAAIEGLPAASIPPRYLAKGSYFTLSGRAPFSHLIYPIPEAAGLGTHLTLDLQGQARFGPDVEWVDAIDYTVDPARADAFYGAIRTYWPGLPDGALQPGYAGIRPKIQAPGEPAADFVIQGEADHGVPGLVNLYGIESPGLTASLAIADRAVKLLA